MTFSICIRTVFRPENYCRYLLKRMVDTGIFENRSVLGVHVSNGIKLTPNMNGIQAIRKAGKDEADWILFLEDDIDFIDDFIGSVTRWLDKFEDPLVLAYPLASFYPSLTRARREDKYWDIPIKDYYGSQAIAMRTVAALDYVNWLLTVTGPEADTKFDLHLGQWHLLASPNVKTLRTPSPCFVDHVGQNSLMGTWERTGPIIDFAGRDWSFRG